MTAIDNIKIRQNWNKEQVEQCAQDLSLKKERAFLMYSASLVLECAPDAIDPEDIVDGERDKQIDFIHIEDDQEKSRATITIIQSKYTEGFSSNVVIQIRNGLDWIFERPKSEVRKLKNTQFKDKIVTCTP